MNNNRNNSIDNELSLSSDDDDIIIADLKSSKTNNKSNTKLPIETSNILDEATYRKMYLQSAAAAESSSASLIGENELSDDDTSFHNEEPD